MKVSIKGVFWCLMVLSIIWPLGCSKIKIIQPKDKPPAAPVPRKIEKPPKIQPEQKPQPATPEMTYFIHTIRWPGENLIRISRWYTGSGNNWLLLAKANPSIDPRRIRIGDSILIPENLLKTRDPMPISSVSISSEQKNNSPASSSESPPSAENVELFGPIDTDIQTGAREITESSPPLETIE
jgi:hypothetical protein